MYAVNVTLPLRELIIIGVENDASQTLVVKGLSPLCELFASCFQAEDRRQIHLLLAIEGQTTDKGLCYRHDLEGLTADLQPWFAVSDVLEYLQPWLLSMGFRLCCVQGRVKDDDLFFAVDAGYELAAAEDPVLLPSGLLALKSKPMADWECDLSTCAQSTFDEHQVAEIMALAAAKLAAGLRVVVSFDLDDTLLLYRQTLQLQNYKVKPATLLHPAVLELLRQFCLLAEKNCTDSSYFSITFYTNRILPAGYTQVELDMAISQLIADVDQYKHPLLADPCSVLSIIKSLCIEFPVWLNRYFIEPACMHLGGVGKSKCEAFQQYYLGDVVGVKRHHETRILVDDSRRQVDAILAYENEELSVRNIRFHALPVRAKRCNEGAVARLFAGIVSRLRDHRTAHVIAGAAARAADAATADQVEVTPCVTALKAR